MQIKFDANKKKLDTNPVFGLLVQGENLAESIQITGPKMVGALDLSQLRVAVRMTSQQYETTVEKTLEQTTDGDTITFTWQVDKQFTGSPGKVDVMLVGYGGNEEVIKITSSGMVVQEDRTFDTAPPESTWEQILQQMQDFATQAYESKTAAANSAAEAAASQKVAEEKAEQATNAASEAVKAAETAAADAAAQAAAKTEQQIRQYADDRYARPLVTKTGPVASLEVYPDKLSNLKVYANGFTQQAGTGDPSPTNVWAITNGGTDNYFVPEMLTPEVTWDAETKTLTKPSSTGIYYDIFNGTTGLNTVATNYIQLLPNTKYVFSAGACDTATEVFVVANDGTVSKITGNLANASIEAETGETGRITIRMYATGKSKAANLSIKKYNTEEIFDYVVSKSGINGVTFLPLTAPLCEGDSVVSWARSGCDQQLTLDGSQLPTSVATLNTVYRIAFTLATPAVSGPQYSESFFEKTDFSLNAEHFYASTNLYVFVDKAKLAGDTKENAQQYFAAHPLTVWYRSTNYTLAADIPVSLETHQQAVLVLDGTETITASTISAGKRFRIEAGNTPNVPVSSIDTGELKCTHYKPISRNSTNGGTQGISFWTPESNGFYVVDDRYIGDSDATNFKAYLAAQYAAGTPVTIVYQLATPITYAHPAVVLPALPDDDGKVTITGQSGGTVTVVFNKSIMQEIAEIKAAMLAMGANLSM